MEGGGVQSDATDVEFGPFRLDTKREQLWRDAQPVEIRRKTWQVLQQLIVDPGRLVSRDELLDTVWPDVEVVPAAVTQSIHELRRAFSDDARHPEFIETVHGRGFRFVAPVRRVVSKREDPGLPRRELSPSERMRSSFPRREPELARLKALFEDARGGQRRVVFVTGEVGIGKTSLVRAFLDDLTETQLNEAPLVVAGACVEHHGEDEAYRPLLNAL
ncbi:MAG: hypothetical protein E2O54_14015, partial [Gammaproteobacteria bacterium]